MNLNFVALQAEYANRTTWTFIRSQRGAPLLVNDGFVYRCERKIGRKSYWLCLSYKKGQHKCNARLILLGNSVTKETGHTHAADKRAKEGQIESKSLDDDDVEVWLKNVTSSSKITQQ